MELVAFPTARESPFLSTQKAFYPRDLVEFVRSPMEIMPPTLWKIGHKMAPSACQPTPKSTNFAMLMNCVCSISGEVFEDACGPRRLSADADIDLSLRRRVFKINDLEHYAPSRSVGKSVAQSKKPQTGRKANSPRLASLNTFVTHAYELYCLLKSVCIGACRRVNAWLAPVATQKRSAPGEPSMSLLGLRVGVQDLPFVINDGVRF
jgi:hypothetical protein